MTTTSSTVFALLVLAAATACGASPDTMIDAIPDASWDESPDETPDASADESPDTSPDASLDESPDAAAVPELAVEVVERGAGDTTVVFESGLGNDWTAWDTVADEVAEKARVFAYSRPGYGTSDPTTAPRDATHIVEALRALLVARGYAPPYLLVGHSFGGAYMELFAKAYPEEVVGVVLVDPRHRDFATACEQAGLEGCVVPADVVATCRSTRSPTSRTAPIRFAPPARSGRIRCVSSPRPCMASHPRSRACGSRCSGHSPTKRMTVSRASS